MLGKLLAEDRHFAQNNVWTYLAVYIIKKYLKFFTFLVKQKVAPVIIHVATTLHKSIFG